MKPHPRIRKTVKWGGAALIGLLVAAWMASARWQVEIAVVPWFGVALTPGGISFVLALPPSSPIEGWFGCKVAARSEFAPWLWSFHRDAKEGFSIMFVPMWALLTVALTPTLVAFRLDTLARRREHMNLCPKCHYDRTGLAEGAACPECGVKRVRHV